ncbi:MAG: glycosyltransferase family 1 protein [Anaerolineae bacterium]|nr:glycosyltransferase family 1 protein [Anaerolineae bacterium]
MNIVLMAFGSRGDIQPFLALAVALRERGHSVSLAAPGDFEAQIGAYGVPYLHIPISNMDFMQSDFSQKAARGITPATLLALWREVVPEMRRALLATMHLVTEAVRDADLLISHGFLVPAAYSIHQKTGIPLVLSIAAPVVSSQQFSPVMPPPPFGKRFLYPLSYQLLVRGVLSFMFQPMHTYRREVGLPKIAAGQVANLLLKAELPVLMHYSKHLAPAATDWNANVRVTGAWPLPAPPNWTPPEKLSAFLAQGEPPVYVGFGSMPVHEPERTSQMISDALRLAGLRGVLQAGWAGMGHEDDHLITIGDAPHDWLFPRMAAIVHHGGAGTTHSAARAGKPALVVPFNADQPFWGRRVAELGVGVPQMKRKQLTVERLAAALRTLTQDNALRERAAEMGARLRAEDGLGAACEWVERHAQ